MDQAHDPSVRGPSPSRPSGPRSRRSVVSSRALAMLTLLPVAEAPVPRVHATARQPDGSLRVHDRPTGQQLVVYTPRFEGQFRDGHRSGRWYVRPATYVGSRPRSPAFETAKAAIDALASGRWSLDPGLSGQERLPLRVHWAATTAAPTWA